MSIEDWHGIYSLSFCITKDKTIKLSVETIAQNFNLSTHSLTVGFKKQKCTLCMETKENLIHLFWNCNLVKQFWFAVKNFLMICGIALPLTAREITLGISESKYC